MGGKKQPGRFTIQFNDADPQQRQVIELLNQQGRRKAVFLTCAVLAYCGQGAAPVIPPPSPPPSLEPAMIEQIVQKVLWQNASAAPIQKDGAGAVASAGCSRDETAFQPPCASAASSLPEDDSDLPDPDLAAICDTIDAFRR